MDLDVTSRRLVERPGVGSLSFFDHRIALRECAEGMGLVATVDIPRGTVVWMSDPEEWHGTRSALRRTFRTDENGLAHRPEG